MRSWEQLALLTESVDRLADMLQAAVNGPQDLDRELLQLLADALRQTALHGGLRRAQPLLTVEDYEDLCEEAACLRRGLYEVGGHRWCRPHALDTALGLAALTWSGGRLPRQPPQVGD